ncbi:MAG: hypothetical protein ACE5JP_09590 [Candidatus Bipolaricaulia bacterium]
MSYLATATRQWESRRGLATHESVEELWEEVIGTSIVRAFEAKVRRLERLFIFQDVMKVTGFIRKYPFLTDLLEEAYVEIQKHFGSNSEVFLELVADPEVQGLVELFGYIAIDLTPEEAGKRLQRFDHEWYFKQLPQVKGRLNFDVKFE